MVIPVEVEHVRVTVGVGIVCCAIDATAPTNSARLYCMCDQESLSTADQVSSF